MHEEPEKIGYASVSGHNQKADLETQAQRLRDYGCDEVITGLGYGLNCRKPGLKRLMSALLSDEVETLVLTHENRVSELNSSLPSAVGRRHRLLFWMPQGKKPLKRNLCVTSSH